MIWGKVRRDFLGERNASFLLHICLLFFQFATKVIKLPKTWQQGQPENSPQIMEKLLPSSLPASKYSSLRNHFSSPLGNKLLPLADVGQLHSPELLHAEAPVLVG